MWTWCVAGGTIERWCKKEIRGHDWELSNHIVTRE